MKNCIAVFLLCAATAAAHAQTVTNVPPASANVREMSLKDCVQVALRDNFDVQIQRENVDIQMYGLRGDYGGYDPTFSMSGQHSHNNTFELYPFPSLVGSNEVTTYLPASSLTDINSFNSGFTGTSPWGLQYNLFGNIDESTETQPRQPVEDFSSGQIGLTATQPLLKNLWIDTTRLTILIAKNSLQQSEQGLRLQFITTVAAVQNAYYELIYAQDNVDVQLEALKLAQTQLDQDRQRVEVGSLAPLDVQQDEAQASSSQAALITARNTLSIDQNTLKNLLVTDYSRWHDTTIQPTEQLTADLQLFDLQDCWSQGMTKRPDLLQARLNVQSQGITLKFDRNQLYPSLDLNGQYGYNGAGQVYSGTFDQYADANHPFYYYGASISFPLSNVKARNTLKSDKATLKQELLSLKELEQNIMVEIDNSVQQVAADYQGVEASHQASVYAAAALDAEQKKYDVGKSTTFTVLQLQNTLTADRGAEIRSIANYNEDLAKLSQNEGTTLDDLNVDIQTR
jgi:outer membrane protein TolC